MTLPAVPDWLSRRDGTLKPGLREYIALVVISDRPEYRLEVRLLQGSINAELGRYDKAITNYTHAIAIAPDNPLPYYAREKTYRALKQQELADVDLAKVRKLDPTGAMRPSLEQANPPGIGQASTDGADSESTGKRKTQYRHT